MPRRRRRYLLKNFRVGALQPRDFARHLILAVDNLVKTLPHGGEIPHDLVDLLRVDGWGGRCARRERFRGRSRWRL